MTIRPPINPAEPGEPTSSDNGLSRFPWTPHSIPSPHLPHSPQISSHSSNKMTLGLAGPASCLSCTQLLNADCPSGVTIYGQTAGRLYPSSDTAFLCFIPVCLTFLPYSQGERKDKLCPHQRGIYHGEVLEVKLLLTSGPLCLLFPLPTSLLPPPGNVHSISSQMSSHQRSDLALK